MSLMPDQIATQIVLTQSTTVSAQALFAVLADPARHAEIDGSGMLRAAVGSAPITGVGDIFTMQMHIAEIGDYQTENHVVEFEPDRRIAWMTAGVGRRPIGQLWAWQIDTTDEQTRTVTHTYDWSQVTDPKMLAMVTFPRVPASDLQQSVARLIAAASTAG
jgi:hypothetical protein